MKIFPNILLASLLLIPAQLHAESTAQENWSFHAGLGSPMVWNYVGISKEYPINEHTSWFLTGGLGTALIGAGIIWYDKREDSGLVASSAIGVVDLQATLAYRFKLGKNDFVSAGGSYGMFFMQCNCWLPVLGYEHRY